MLIERLKSFATLLFERNVLVAFFYFIEKLSFCKILFKINEWILIIIQSLTLSLLGVFTICPKTTHQWALLIHPNAILIGHYSLSQNLLPMGDGDTKRWHTYFYVIFPCFYINKCPGRKPTTLYCKNVDSI
jgi:hypothetical protein